MRTSVLDKIAFPDFQANLVPQEWIPIPMDAIVYDFGKSICATEHRRPICGHHSLNELGQLAAPNDWPRLENVRTIQLKSIQDI